MAAGEVSINVGIGESGHGQNAVRNSHRVSSAGTSRASGPLIRSHHRFLRGYHLTESAFGAHPNFGSVHFHLVVLGLSGIGPHGIAAATSVKTVGKRRRRARRRLWWACRVRRGLELIGRHMSELLPTVRLQKQLASYKLLIIDELGYVPLSQTGSELLFEVFSQRYERASTVVTSNLPFDEWTSVFGSERLTGALLDRLTHHVHILEMNGDSYRLKQSKRSKS